MHRLSFFTLDLEKIIWLLSASWSRAFSIFWPFSEEVSWEFATSFPTPCACLALLWLYSRSLLPASKLLLFKISKLVFTVFAKEACPIPFVFTCQLVFYDSYKSLISNLNSSRPWYLWVPRATLFVSSFRMNCRPASTRWLATAMSTWSTCRT